MRRPGGYAVWSQPDGKTIERDTITCAHCNVIVVLAPGADPGGFCRLCMKALCGGCADKGVCSPFEKKLERIENAGRFLRAAGVE